VLGALVVTAATVPRIGGLAWAGVALSAAGALAVAFGRKVIDVVSERPTAALKNFLDRDEVLRAIPGFRRLVRESTSRITLDIHPAIPLPADHPAGLSDEFPLYVPRDIDAHLRGWIHGHAADGGLVLLVGPAASGKTRSLSAALQAELPGWQFLMPTSMQLNKLVAARADLARSVIWLNELQDFFIGEPLRVRTVEALLAGELGPVVLAGTIRGRERDRLLGRTAVDPKEMNLNANAILRMPARWSGALGGTERAVCFDLPGQLSARELAAARELAERDPRLRIALRDTRDGAVIATLACAAELVERWRGQGDRAGQALVTAAVVARRCGHPEPIPQPVLTGVALAHLSAQGQAPGHSGWPPEALGWAQRPVMDTGDISALSVVRTKPGVVDGYRVSDILLQNSYDMEYPDIRGLLADERIWYRVFRDRSRSAAAEIALSAYKAGHLGVARDAWKAAARRGDGRAARRLGLLCWEQDRDREAEKWLRRAVRLGSVGAVSSLGDWLAQHGHLAEAKQLLRSAADRGDVNAMTVLGFYLGGQGDLQSAEQWSRKAAESGDAVAMANLGYRLARRGAYAEAESWGLKAAALGVPGAMHNLGLLYEERGEVAAALTWYRRGAERGYADVQAGRGGVDPWPGESRDGGISNTILCLAELLQRTGQSAEAEHWYWRGAELGDARAAAALAAVFASRGDAAAALSWRAQAAALARANLTRNEGSLRAAYGELAIHKHSAIMAAHAVDLASQGRAAEAADWYRQAAQYGYSGYSDAAGM
jgi:hypothetical protein